MSEQRPVEKDVLPTGQLGMKPGPKLQERRHASPNPDPPTGWVQHAGDDLQERAPPRAVAPDDPKHLASINPQGDVAQGPKFVVVDTALHPANRVLFERS